MTVVRRRVKPRVEDAVKVGGIGSPVNHEVFSVVTRETDDGYCNYPFPTEEAGRLFVDGCVEQGQVAKLKSSRRGVIYAPEVASTLTSGISNTAGVNSSGRRQEDDHNLVATIAASGSRLRHEDMVVTPIDTSQAQRTSGATGVGTPGTGIGEPGDPSPALGASRATPAVAISYGYADEWPDDQPVLSLNENLRGEVAANTHVGTISTGGGKPGQGYPAVLDRRTVVAFDGKDGRTGDVAHTLTAPDTNAKRQDGSRLDRIPHIVGAITTGSLNRYDDNTARAGQMVVAAPGECGCCPVDTKPDSARYRSMGNAVTVPVITWIGHRLMGEFA